MAAPKITLEKLAPYLPYGIKVKLKFARDTQLPWYYEDKEYFILEGMMLDWYNSSNITQIKPLLIPLSEFNESKADEEIFDTGKYYTSIILNEACDLPYWEFEILCKHHFDVFGLIDQGLALNKLKYEAKEKI